MKKLTVIIIFFVVFLISLSVYLISSYETTMVKGPGKVIHNDSLRDFDESIVEDLLKIEPIKSINLTGVDSYKGSSGMANLVKKDEKYFLISQFKNLPKLNDISRYRSWLILKGPSLAHYSLDIVKEVNGLYTNVYITDEDITKKMNLYGLTIQSEKSSPGDLVLIGQFPYDPYETNE